RAEHAARLRLDAEHVRSEPVGERGGAEREASPVHPSRAYAQVIAPGLDLQRAEHLVVVKRRLDARCERRGDEPRGPLQRLALRAEGRRAVVLAEDGELVAPRAIGAPAPPREPGFIARAVLVVGGARKAQPERGPQLARGELKAMLPILDGRIALERRPELALGAIGPALPQHDVADADARA